MAKNYYKQAPQFHQWPDAKEDSNLGLPNPAITMTRTNNPSLDKATPDRHDRHTVKEVKAKAVARMPALFLAKQKTHQKSTNPAHDNEPNELMSKNTLLNKHRPLPPLNSNLKCPLQKANS